jgi:hypothetical protein
VDEPTSDDPEYLAEFERQQFALYDTRRLTAETHSNAVVAAAVTIAALVLSDFSRKGHPSVGWLVVALVGLLWVLVLATVARVVSWKTPRWRGGAKWEGKRPSDEVGDTLAAVRAANAGDPATRRRTLVCARHKRMEARHDERSPTPMGALGIRCASRIPRRASAQLTGLTDPRRFVRPTGATSVVMLSRVLQPVP